jgi:hypothetical protein
MELRVTRCFGWGKVNKTPPAREVTGPPERGKWISAAAIHATATEITFSIDYDFIGLSWVSATPGKDMLDKRSPSRKLALVPYSCPIAPSSIGGAL